MMKMKSKRDRRLLTQEVPVLSDQIPGATEGEQPHTINQSKERQHHERLQQHEQAKKGSWKRLFGKGGGSGDGAAKRKEDHSRYSSIGEGGDTINNELHPVRQSYSSVSDGVLHSQQQQQPEGRCSINLANNYKQSPRVSDKRDDVTESSQSILGSDPIKHILNDIDPHSTQHSPTSTESTKNDTTSSSSSSRNKGRFSSMRSSSKRTSRDQSSPSMTANGSVSSPQQIRERDNQVVSPVSSGGDSNKRSTSNSYQQQQTQQWSSSTSTSNKIPIVDADVKKILSKPYGREHILTTEQTWVVHVARAEWEPDESLWKYRINIKKRNGNKLQDFANCFTLRSLGDFHWLEQALMTEFFGGLLLPSLSIYLGLPDILSCQHEIDSQLLSNWLSDTLNGIRGQGEIMFLLTKVEITTCESMEAFLYRSELVHQPVEKIISTSPKNNKATSKHSPRKISNNHDGFREGDNHSEWNFFFPELCYTDCVGPQPKDVLKTPLTMVTKCHSPALGSAKSFNIQDSFVEPVTFNDLNTSLAIHADLLKAECDLIWSWRTRALQAMEKLRILQEQEKYIGAAWKRFAICVSNLFAYEKDIETARLGDSKSRRDLQIPYRKLQKSAVDDCLRILTRQKVERATPSIEAINTMLSAYVADLSTVQPSVQAYLGGLQQFALRKSKIESIENDELTKSNGDPSGTLADKIQASLKVVKKQLTSNQDDLRKNESKEEDRRYLQRQQLQTIENRLLMNEALLKDYMTTLCKTTPVRTARMIYTYLEKEIAQCNALHNAAVEMKGKINVASKESLSKMIHRHHAERKGDQEIEIRLVHKIVNIGNTRKFVKEEGDGNSEEVEKGVELSFEMEEQESQKMKRRDKAMNNCRDRIGRWNAKLAMEIMEAVGVSDANVRVEETTRDLRMVRKYAISLRENVDRCLEGVENLRMSILQGSLGDIRDIRADFMTEMKNLLSFAYVPVDDQMPYLSSTHLMDREGIDLSDPSGWRTNDRGSCGNALNSYVESRDSGTEWVLESLSELLKEYSQRVEAIESFVYMECVGIQLEKYFSQARASALTAFEKKTDITSAVNIATRKKMPVLVKELQGKLKSLGSVVSHTTVKEAKEAHLESKALKQELHALAMRRLVRARETSTERAIALMTIWSKEEEGSTRTEKEILEDLTLLVQESIKKEDLAIYVVASPARI